LPCHALIVAVSAPQASQLLVDVDRTLADQLAKIEYAGTSIVSLGYRRAQIAGPLESFGFVVPACEKRRILAGSFSSVKFAGRAPDDDVLVRVFIGGACQSTLAERPNDELKRIATEELGELLGVQGEPTLVDIARWPHSMPQYHLGHCELVESIEQRAAGFEGLALCGNAYHGVGIPNCIHSGESAAEHVVALLKK
jgi:oxygen-dependent protoporphyrinogen oxidase